MMVILGILCFIVIALIAGVVIYNNLIRTKNQTDEAWSGIDVQLKRRYDLIPQLVETVKGYTKHEAGTFEKIVAQRSKCMNAASVDERIGEESVLGGMLKSVFALSEAYPELKANVSFIELQKSLADVEENLQAARRYYNASARDYNNLVETFPSNLIANNFGFKRRSFFELADEAERQSVPVSF